MRLASGLCLAFLMLNAAGSFGAGSRDDDLRRLEQVNQRWMGARCRIRIELPVKKGHDADGWSKSALIARGVKHQYSRIWVSNRDVLPNGKIPHGAALIAEGWSLEKGDRGGLVLSFRFAAYQARARMRFIGAFGRNIGLADLADIERWLRFELFEVQAGDERLTASPRGKRSRKAPPAADRGSPIVLPGTTAESRQATLSVLAAAVEPTRVAAGEDLQLEVTYQVGGTTEGQTVTVVERRSILRRGEVLKTLETELLRASGTYQSSQSLAIPGFLEPGVYELVVTVSFASLSTTSATGRALFEVTDGP